LLQGHPRVRGESAPIRLIEQLADVEAKESGGDQPEKGERGIAAADVFRVHPGAPEPLLLGELVQRRPGIRDGDEMRAGSALRLRVPLREMPRSARLQSVHQRAEVAIERSDLGRGAALRRDEEERASEIETVDRAANGIGNGRVEHPQVEPTTLLAE